MSDVTMEYSAATGRVVSHQYREGRITIEAQTPEDVERFRLGEAVVVVALSSLRVRDLGDSLIETAKAINERLDSDEVS